MIKTAAFDLDKIVVEEKGFAVPRTGYVVELVLNPVQAKADMERCTVEMSIHVSNGFETEHLIDFENYVLEWGDLPRRKSNLEDWERLQQLLDDGFNPNDAYLDVVSNFFFPDTKVDIEMPSGDSETVVFSVQIPGLLRTFTSLVEEEDFHKYFKVVK